MEATAEDKAKPPSSVDVKPDPGPSTSSLERPEPPTHATPSSMNTITTQAPSSASQPLNESKKDDPPPELSKTSLLQQQIQTIASLQTRLQRIRSLPAHLLIFHAQSPLISLGALSGLGLGDGNGSSESDAINSILNADAGAEVSIQGREMGSQARVAFRMVEDAKQELAQPRTQDALKASHESEAQDKSEIVLHGRRSRKKR